jgi:hypothetical protein
MFSEVALFMLTNSNYYLPTECIDKRKLPLYNTEWITINKMLMTLSSSQECGSLSAVFILEKTVQKTGYSTALPCSHISQARFGNQLL